MTKVVSFFNNKGGVAKTTSTWNIGASLANKKFKVLLIDLDPQHNLTQISGIKELSSGTYNVLVDKSDIQPIELRKNLYLLAGSIELNLVESLLASVFKREFVLNDKLMEVKNQYDYVLIDCPPAFTTLTINGLIASDYYVVPMTPDELADNGVEMTDAYMKSVEVESDFILITRFDNRIKSHEEKTLEMRGYFPDKVMKTIIHENTRLSELAKVNKDIFDHSKNSTGAKDYEAATKELINLLN